MASLNSSRRELNTTSLFIDILPGCALEEVAKFLAPISKILFAITVTPPSSPYDTIMARNKRRTRQWSIVGKNWDTLDFGDIEKELAVKLTDDDIKNVLLHIDAAHKLKRLHLTNCVNIKGNGLAPLTNSTSIEQIDLSLVGYHQCPKLDPMPALSRYSVLPILESIIVQEWNSLKHVQFPHSWRQCDAVKDTVFNEFIVQYNEMMTNRSRKFCELCNLRLEPEHNCLSNYFVGSGYGIQDDTCSVCVKTNNHCWECNDWNSNHTDICYECCRRYCVQCSTMVPCGVCEHYSCSSCIGSISCAASDCEVIVCDDCRSSEWACRKCLKTWCNDCDDCIECDNCSERCCRTCCPECESCDKNCCRTCSSSEDSKNGVHTCEDCNKAYCDECRMRECQDGYNTCKTCVRMISLLLLEKTRTQEDKIEDLEARHDDLMLRISLLSTENHQMKKSLATINRLSRKLS